MRVLGLGFKWGGGRTGGSQLPRGGGRWEKRSAGGPEQPGVRRGRQQAGEMGGK